jgi:GNAT superfamily N-acetyltransferase
VAPVTPVRRATTADTDAVVATITQAFEKDPAWPFIIDGQHPHSSEHFARALFLSRVDAGTVWVTDDVAAVAMWEYREPGQVGGGHDESVWDDYRAAVGEHLWARLDAWEEALDASRPTPPYWYLGVLGTRPDSLGRGLATSVMEPVLELADHDHLDCWLETANEDNLLFYERRGFAHRLPVDVPGGPPTWWLRRAPAARVIR